MYTPSHPTQQISPNSSSLKILAKWNNLDFPEIAGVPFPFLNHHLGGFPVVWGRDEIWPENWKPPTPWPQYA